MKIAILSGKGGAGKTAVAVNLAATLGDVTLIDCDVEEPNCHLFFPTEDAASETVYRRYPAIDRERCTVCRKCVDFCRFGAFLATSERIMPMPEFCHDCGGCALVCPENAIRFDEKELGLIKRGSFNNPALSWGELQVGEISGIPLIQKQLAEDSTLVVVDGPPGTACPAVATVEVCDFAVLVGEATPFGVSDLTMVVEMLEKLGIPFGIVTNKTSGEDDPLRAYCSEKAIPHLGTIPFSRNLAGILSRGEIAVKMNGEMAALFGEIAGRIMSAAGQAVSSSEGRNA